MPKIIALAGSARKDSFNFKLLKVAADLARAKGAEVDLIDMRDYSMPIYDGDFEVENGLPENAQKLKSKFLAADALLIASPEYNSSISPLLKNTIDWISRPSAEGEQGLSAYRGKVAAIISTSPGALGGLRGLAQLRSILENIQVMVVPTQAAVGSSFSAFNDDGSLSDDKNVGRLKAVVSELVSVARKLQA